MHTNQHWLEVVQRAPLVSIDLIVRDSQGRVLLGLRNNRPARDTWFVPGGVIRKGESIDQAFSRIATVELGRPLQRSHASFKGVYEHFYQDNFAGEPDTATHYVVLAHEITVPDLDEHGPLDQHRELRLFTPTQLLADAAVHDNTKAYFTGQ
ncbi:GDP-mannose mannosyl hydrolase [Hydrocarboniphaga sp.]|uniref:GDP-mannose mannosyl hydrolase n=1 Tax=Hydrocarboniphaga sp. TaxID=2033016 RepID=UPI003D1488F3